MQKVIKGSGIDNFVSQNRDIRGFVAKQGDAGTEVFGTSDEMIEGLRLDYDGGFQGETSVGVVEWDFDDTAMSVDIPRSAEFGGDVVNAKYPFVGNGFTATKSGRLVPEYELLDRAIPPEGAKLYELAQNGNKTLRAIFSNGAWLPQ